MCHVITVIIRIISFRIVIRLTFTMASLLPFLFDFPKYLNNRSEHASWKRGVHSGKMTGFSRFWLIFRLNKNWTPVLTSMESAFILLYFIIIIWVGPDGRLSKCTFLSLHFTRRARMLDIHRQTSEGRGGVRVRDATTWLYWDHKGRLTANSPWSFKTRVGCKLKASNASDY